MSETVQPPLRVFFGGLFLSGHGGARSPIEDLADRLENCGWTCSRSSTIRNGLMRGANVLFAAIARRVQYQVAVIDLFSGRAFLWGEAAGKLLQLMRVPFIYSMHGGALPEFARSRPNRVRRCLARASAVTAPSRYLLETMHPYRPDAVLLPNALEIAQYSFRLRRHVQPRLIWVRRFHEIYNPEMAVEVLAALAERFPEAILTMVGGDAGDGSLARVKQLAHDKGVFDKILFTGAVDRDKVAGYLDQADVFLNTTNFDNTPVSVLEALAMGLCVVTTNAGGLPYLVEHDVDALITPCGDARAMADAVARILNNPALAQRLSDNGRRKTTAFDWSVVLEQWKQLLSRVAGRDANSVAPCLVHNQPEGA